MSRQASSQVTGAILLVVGLVIGAGLVFASLYVIGRPTATVMETSTQFVPSTLTQYVTETTTQLTTSVATSTQPITEVVTQTYTTTATVLENSSIGLSVGAGSSLVTITGGISVSSGTGTGVLTLTIKNGASNPITAILLKSLDSNGVDYYCPAASTDALCTTKTDPTLTWTPATVPPGGTASTSVGYSPCMVAAGFSSGTTYTALVQVTFSTGGLAIYTYDMTAQL